MEQALVNAKIIQNKTKNVIKSNKCNQCDYASSHLGHLRIHLKMHSGEKPNKCELFICGEEPPEETFEHIQ